LGSCSCVFYFILFYFILFYFILFILIVGGSELERFKSLVN